MYACCLGCAGPTSTGIPQLSGQSHACTVYCTVLHSAYHLQAHLSVAVKAEDSAEGSAMHGADSNSNAAGTHTAATVTAARHSQLLA